MNPTILANAVKDTIDNEDIKGFIQPYVGIRLFKNLSPNIMINSNNINSPIGINKVNYIASKLGLNKNMCFTFMFRDCLNSGVSSYSTGVSMLGLATFSGL